MRSSSWKDKDNVNSFLSGRRSAIPYANDQLYIMMYLLSHLERKIESFIDIGSGDGILSHLILDKFSNSNGFLIDFSEPMIEAAKKRLNNYFDRIKIIGADISTNNWINKLNLGENDKFDAAVSGYCIHHLTHGRKYELYSEIYNLLQKNGIFVNIEHIESTSNWGEIVSEDFYIDSLYNYERNLDNPRTIEKIREDYNNRTDRKDNILLSLDVQLDWLREIGFKSVDIYFKCFEFAVFAGIR